MPLNRAIIQQARLGSSRVSKKLLQEVGGKTLLDRGLDYMVQMREETGCQLFVACPEADKEIVHAAWAREMEVFYMTPESTNSEEWCDNIRGWGEYLEGFGVEWVWHSNILCRPFLTIETGKKILAIEEPSVVTLQQRGVIWHGATRDTIPTGYMLSNSKTNPVYQEFAHLACVFPPAYYRLPEPLLAYHLKPYPMNLSTLEQFDIDLPGDLEIARHIANSMEGKS